MMNEELNESGSAPDRYAHWIPVGLIAAGLVGAVAGLSQCGTKRYAWRPGDDRGELTPPHGDKLLSREPRW